MSQLAKRRQKRLSSSQSLLVTHREPLWPSQFLVFQLLRCGQRLLPLIWPWADSGLSFVLQPWLEQHSWH